MKVLLNLLPGEERKRMRRRYYDRFFFRQSVLILFIGVFCLLVLGSVFLIVRENRLATEAMSQEELRSGIGQAELLQYEEAFAESNASVSRALGFYREHPSWTAVLLALDRSVPDAITIEAISTKDYQIFVGGMAETRDDFLTFEKQLREEPCFSEVEAPVSNLFSRENVEFQVDITVTPACLKPNRNR
jgi:Tfp pilus assembly protein PilN